MPRRMLYDPWLFFTAGLLVLVGLLMVGSASTYVALQAGRDPSAFLVKHAVHAMLGFGVVGVTLFYPYQRLADRRLVLWMLAGCLAALLGVLAMPAAGGAHRWFPLGPVNLQPSEFAKIVVVLFMAYVLSRREHKINELWSVPVPCLTVVSLTAFLVAIEPDLGSAVLLAAVASVMLFTAGLTWRYILVLLGFVSAGFVVAVLAEPYRLRRILSFFDPSSDPLGAGFQLNQSLIAIGTGGLTGTGFGQGTQKAYYVPAPHTDFIYSVLGEEFGLIGTVLVLAAFLLLYWRGLRAAVRAPDRFGFYLALGLTNLLVLQALINICVCVGLLPTKGLPLPFLSYGGSSLLASMAAVGLLLNVSQHSN